MKRRTHLTLVPPVASVTSRTGAPVVATRRLAVVATPVPARRRVPRRQIVTPVSLERRRIDRRERSLGLDGLLRTVLADDWS